MFLTYFRCGSWQIINGMCIQIQTLCNDRGSTLFLPREFKFYSSDLTRHHVTSLLELSTRQVFQQTLCDVRCILPRVLENELRSGPVAQCYSSSCHNCIFSEAIGWPVHTNSTEIQHSVLFFCSTQCAVETLNILFSL